MNKRLFFFATGLILFVCANAQNKSFPQGDIKGPYVWNSKIYAGTFRNYWLYIPKQYDSAKPACLMVVQDGLSCAAGWKLPTVLDSLINTHEVPVMIGLFIGHGTVASSDTSNYPRYNRSFEYDAPGDRYARFLLDEILPEVSRTYNISKNPNDRSIGGASSGAICAFNVAWERPDAFRRVISSIGSYVGLRGADQLPTLIRQTEQKPLRIFLEDGNNDLNIYAGDWWMANQSMLSAFKYAGYEVNNSWGTGGHNNKGISAILPEALKWLWKDYPLPVATHIQPTARVNLLKEGENWKEVSTGKGKINGLTVDKEGSVFIASHQTIYKIDAEDKLQKYIAIKGGIGALCFGNDSQLFVSIPEQHKIIAIKRGIAQDFLQNVNAHFFTVSGKGIYYSEPSKDRIGYYNFKKKTTQYLSLAGHPKGLAISAEQSFLNVGLENSVFGYSFKIMEDGSLAYGQEYAHYHIPYGKTTPGVNSMTVDSQNLLYTTTAMGIQVTDQLGRVNYIFSKPAEGAAAIVIGGSGFNTLYVTCDEKLFSRKINATGIASWLPAIHPPKPGL